MLLQQETYVYDTRKNSSLKQYKDSSDSEENSDSCGSDQDYHPLSDDEDFSMEKTDIFSQFDRYLKGPDRKVKGSS